MNIIIILHICDKLIELWQIKWWIVIKKLDQFISTIWCFFICKIKFVDQISDELLHIAFFHRFINRKEYKLYTHILQIQIHVSNIQDNLSQWHIIRLQIHQLVCYTEHDIYQFISVNLLGDKLIHRNHGRNRICKCSLSINILFMTKAVVSYKWCIVQLDFIMKDLDIIFNFKI